MTGGAEGLMLSIDPHALGVTNQAEVAKGKDILNVFILISVPFSVGLLTVASLRVT